MEIIKTLFSLAVLQLPCTLRGKQAKAGAPPRAKHIFECARCISFVCLSTECVKLRLFVTKKAKKHSTVTEKLLIVCFLCWTPFNSFTMLFFVAQHQIECNYSIKNYYICSPLGKWRKYIFIFIRERLHKTVHICAHSQMAPINLYVV